MKITLPTKKAKVNTSPEIEFDQLIVIGANGAGKTRFGSNIERRYNTITHRISAQKSLSMPTYVGTKSKDVAVSEFLYGGWSKTDNNSYYRGSGRFDTRWGGNLNTHLLNDYENLMVLLHTEEYEESLNYKENGGVKPLTKLDRIQKIWEDVLPHRTLTKRAGVIETSPKDQTQDIYNASEMSDGERIIFYLIGEVVCAPQDCIIIIDEPEMHIHRSLVKSLFDLIEIERPDCAFIYLTHDIDFAFTRHNAVKVWAKSYDGNDVWDYEVLDEQSPIPEQLYLEVLGSRKPIIFLEGDDSSIDYELYELVYHDYTIKPVGSCEKVIQTVKSFNEQSSFHHITSFGIIDRDRRKEHDIAKLSVKNIWVLDVAEAENLLLEENIVKAIATHMGNNPDKVFQQVKNNLFKFFRNQLHNQAILHYKESLRQEFLKLTNLSSKNIDENIKEVDSLYIQIDKKKIHNDILQNFEKILSNLDYDGVLRFFNLKNALIPESKVCELTGVRNRHDYLKLVITLLKRRNEVSNIIIQAIERKIIK